MYFAPQSKPRPLLFDLGDTLINFTATNPLPYVRMGTQLAYRFMQDKGLQLPPFEKYLRACRWRYALALLSGEIRRREVDLYELIGRLHRACGLPHDDDFLLVLADHFYQPMKALGTPEEGVHAILQKLADRHHPMGIVSNTMVPGAVLDQHLQDAGLLRFFPARIYSCDIGVKKPNPRIFRAAMRALNIRPQGTVFIGDKARLDVKGARRLGMITVLKVRQGTARRSRHRPDHIIKHLAELPALLEQIGTHVTERGPLIPMDQQPERFSPRTFRPLPSPDQVVVSRSP